MKPFKHIIIILFIFILANSCIKTLTNYKLNEKPYKLVIHGSCSPDSLMKLYITRSLPYFSKQSYKLNTEATVNVYSNGELLESLDDLGNGWYGSNSFYPAEGQSYEIVAEAEGYESARASIHIPEKMDIELLEYTVTEHEPEGCYGCSPDYRLNISFNLYDNVNEENYYDLSLILNVKEFIYEEDSVYDPVFDEYFVYDYRIIDSMNVEYNTPIETNEHIVDIEKYGYDYWKVSPDYTPYGDELIFRDLHFNGETFSFSFYASDIFYTGYDINSISLRITSVEKDFYTYATSMAAVSETEDNPIAEPASVFTNIDGGLGIAYGYTQKNIEIEVPEIEDYTYY